METPHAVRAAFGPTRPTLIAVSGEYTKGADRVLMELSGFHHFLTKPCVPKILLAILNKTERRAFPERG